MSDHITTREESQGKRPSLRNAINEMCKACLYEPGGGGGAWRQQIEACTAPGCPLYHVRPRTTAEQPDTAARAAIPAATANAGEKVMPLPGVRPNDA